MSVHTMITDTTVEIVGASETIISFGSGTMSVKTDGEVTIHVPSKAEGEFEVEEVELDD